MRTLFRILPLLLPALALASASGPSNGLSGAPGEGNCTQCHGGNALDSGNGAFSISGPETYVPGETYTFTVTLQDPGQRRWGFELSPGNQGQIAVTDAAHTQLATASGRQYLKHTNSGTFNNTQDGPVSWSFDWTAPSEPADVVFYAMGNAANGNGSTGGDFIYSATFTTTPATAVAPGARPDAFALLDVVPNPFNPSAEIRYRLDQAGVTRLDVYDLAGRKVASLVDNVQGAGSHVARWNGQTAAGRPAAAGVYLARLQQGSKVQVARMLLVK